MNSKNLILIDIFSYSCMNCLRSLEFIKKIDSKYKKYGLNTILIHPPEWEFEKNSKNIPNALKTHKIKFPMIIDKNKKIIKKLRINFWPTQILLKNDKILYKHIGEGNYKKLEDNVIKHLEIKTKRLFNKEPEYSKFPTIYCGKKKDGKVLELKNKKLSFGAIYIDNKSRWKQDREFLKSTKNNSSLIILTKGNTINFVAKSINKKPIKIGIRLGNRFVKEIIINKPQLYKIISVTNKKQNKLSITTKQGLAVYSFSFQ